ncbi:unnamed protein product [Schistosoma mattheei]|uniref:Uncharacterized protein n=1 Tax=Schistosoma mattheei TaxID=31246 RepID=A0A183PGC6_9TREM|nr:unnamed protein product [Schistosoma mattheei]
MKQLISLLYIIFIYTIGKRLFSKRKLLREAGEWAIVTGATDGIGKVYAEELANDGLKIMLISRNEEKLLNTDVYQRIQEAIDQLSSIACLVNNVGMGVPKLDYYATADYITIDFIKNIVFCNTLPIAMMTHIVLPKMLKQSTTGMAIINIGSHSGYRAFPFLSLYSATKAFVNQLSRSISNENYDHRIHIQTVCPMFVSTAMNGYCKMSLFVPNAKEYVKCALDMYGVEQETFGYIGHAIKEYFTSLLPNSIWKYYMLFMKSWFDKHKKQ